MEGSGKGPSPVDTPHQNRVQMGEQSPMDHQDNKPEVRKRKNSGSDTSEQRKAPSKKVAKGTKESESDSDTAESDLSEEEKEYREHLRITAKRNPTGRKDGLSWLFQACEDVLYHLKPDFVKGGLCSLKFRKDTDSGWEHYQRLNQRYSEFRQANEKLQEEVASLKKQLEGKEKEFASLKGQMEKDKVLASKSQELSVPAQKVRQGSQLKKVQKEHAGTKVLSYATVTKQMTQKMDIKQAKHTGRTVRHVVTVYPKDPKADSEATKKIMTKCFNPSSEKLQIKGVKRINNGGVLVETATKDDLKKLTENKDMANAGLTVGVPPKKRPKMVIYNAPNIAEKELLAALIKQNNGVFTEDTIKDIKPLFKTGKSEETANWVVETSPSMRTKLQSRKRLFIEWHACPVRDYVVACRCYRCQAFGHIAKHCRASVDTCGHCAQEGHTFKECPNKEQKPACINCKRAKRPHKHSSRADECPAYRIAKEILASKTDYGET